MARSSRLAAHLTTKEVIKELKSYPHIIQPNSLLDIFTTLPTQDLAEIPVDDLLELGINSRLDSKKIFFDKKFGVLVNLLKAEIKQKEQILPILDYFSRVSPPVQLLTPNLIQNLLESIFALKGEMSREQLKNALLVCTMLVKGLAREDVGEEDYFDISERFTSLVMRNQGLRDLVREVLHHDEFGFCFTSFVSDSGEKIEIGFFKSIDLSRSDQRRFVSRLLICDKRYCERILFLRPFPKIFALSFKKKIQKFVKLFRQKLRKKINFGPYLQDLVDY